jgi:ubiquinone/menaquinone biosynthesis C-methylase UbiE
MLLCKELKKVFASSRRSPFSNAHRVAILDQFSKQSIPFTAAQSISDGLTTLVRDVAQANSQDVVCDVACGGGLVSCAFAPYVDKVEGIDITPAMISRAKVLATERKLSNVKFQLGDAVQLPYESNTFSIVVSRYSVHHMPHPNLLISEMRRVCRVGGRVVIADVIAPVHQAQAFNKLEILRDPSHVRNLTVPI